MTRTETNQLIEQLKAELSQNEYDLGGLDFDNNSDDDYENIPSGISAGLSALRRNYYINSGVRSVSSGIKWTIKKMIEKVVGPYVKPIINDQNLYNINLLQMLEELSDIIEQQEKEIEQLKQKLPDNQ